MRNKRYRLSSLQEVNPEAGLGFARFDGDKPGLYPEWKVLGTFTPELDPMKLMQLGAHVGNQLNMDIGLMTLMDNREKFESIYFRMRLRVLVEGINNKLYACMTKEDRRAMIDAVKLKGM